MRVWLDTSPLQSGHAHRGIGAYTRFLLQAFQKFPQKNSLEILTEKPEVPPDLIHYPFFDLFFHTLTVPKHVPVVVTIHDVIPLIFPQHYKPGIKGTIRFWLQRWQLLKVSAVITDSETSRQDIYKYLRIPLERIWTIPLAANPEIEPVSEYLQRKYAEELKVPDDYIVYVGDINYNKNIPTLLLALTQLPEDIHLCVVSRTFRNRDIPEGKLLAKIISENNLQDRVHVLDIPGDQPEMLSAILGRSRCLVQPSLYEGFGLPVLEAMKAGAIVVSTNAGSLPEVAGAVAIQVEPTLAGLMQGIQQAWKLRGEERANLVEAGKSWANTFSWDRTAQQTAQVYEAVFLQKKMRDQQEKEKEQARQKLREKK